METKQIKHSTGIYLVQKTGEGSWTKSVQGFEAEGLWRFGANAPTGWYRKSYMRSGCGHAYFLAYSQGEPGQSGEDLWLKGTMSKDMYLCFGPAVYREATPLWSVSFFSKNGEPVETAYRGTKSASICHQDDGTYLVSVVDTELILGMGDGEYITATFGTCAQARELCEQELL